MRLNNFSCLCIDGSLITKLARVSAGNDKSSGRRWDKLRRATQYRWYLIWFQALSRNTFSWQLATRSMLRALLQTGRLESNHTPGCDVLSTAKSSPKVGTFKHTLEAKRHEAVNQRTRWRLSVLVPQSSMSLAHLRKPAGSSKLERRRSGLLFWPFKIARPTPTCSLCQRINGGITASPCWRRVP
jgi:hypothetical protein